jgi:hypothetical protein
MSPRAGSLESSFRNACAVFTNVHGVVVEGKAWFNHKDRCGMQLKVKRFPEDINCACDEVELGSICRCEWRLAHEITGMAGERLESVMMRAAAKSNEIRRCRQCSRFCFGGSNIGSEAPLCTSCYMQELVEAVANSKKLLLTGRECPCCLEDMWVTRVIPLPCKHLICLHCARRLHEDQCPLCRAAFEHELIDERLS